MRDYPLQLSPMPMDVQRVSDGAIVSDYIDGARQWKLPELAVFVPSEVVDDIASIPLPTHNVADKLIWCGAEA